MPTSPLGVFNALKRQFVSKPNRDYSPEELKMALEPYAKRGVSLDERTHFPRYTFRLDIPSRTKQLPISQNIPSNMAYMGEVVKGTLRPPHVDSRVARYADADTQTHIKNRIKEVTGEPDGLSVHLPLTSDERTYRPHVALEPPATVEVYLNVTDNLVSGYADEFNPGD